MSKDLATKGITGDLATQIVGNMQVEGTDSSDLALSYLKLFHGTSDEVANLGDDFEVPAGSFYDSVTEQLVETEDNPFLIAFGKKEFLVWDENRVVDRATKRGELPPESAQDAVETWQFGILFEDSDMPYILSMKSTSIKAARKMYRTLTDRMVQYKRNPEGGFNPPLFELGWKFDTNPEGQKYRRLTVKLSKKGEVSEDWIKRSLEWGEVLRSVNIDEVAKDGNTDTDNEEGW